MLGYGGTIDMSSSAWVRKLIKENGKLLDKLAGDGLIWKEKEKRNISQSQRSRILLC